ncbi:MAG: flagellar biosynthesis protein FlhB [Oscillospiraceae bacterium]|jgi:flagellar biosynthetic protein FlhB|nr:flagellar biosynthesis protein FlhB [Oscillospiraceae bacterium]
MSQASEKTEKATPKKRKDAREKGQVRRSSEVNTTFCCFVMFGLLLLIWPQAMDSLMAIFRDYIGTQSIVPISESFDIAVFEGLLARVLLSMLGVLFPILVTALVAGVAVNLVQVGFLFTTKSLGVKINRISPISGFKRMFSVHTVVELLKSLLKIAFIGSVAYLDYRNLLNDFPGFIGQDVYNSLLRIMRAAFLIALKICLAMALVAAADFLYQWWKYEKDLRMTKQEVKDEYKLMEGDPQIKGRIRQKQRQMSAMRMMSRVPEADVVITNRTHCAVALKYEEEVNGAPVLVAKGQDYIARKIKEVAMEHKVEIVENKPLAQSLYALCEIDDEIPPEFYQAVADILVFVYKARSAKRFAQ